MKTRIAAVVMMCLVVLLSGCTALTYHNVEDDGQIRRTEFGLIGGWGPGGIFHGVLPLYISQEASEKESAARK
jgi:hypothetical protein